MKNQYLRNMAEGLLHLADTMPDCKDNADDVLAAVTYVGTVTGHAASILLGNRDDIHGVMNVALEEFTDAFKDGFNAGAKNHESVH